MDTNASRPDDLSKLEARLAEWRPRADGLATDAMLFAAGRASARRGKAGLVWPIVSGCLALVAVVLGARLGAERSERLALLQELRARPAQFVPAVPLVAEQAPAIKPPAPDSYLVLSREWYRYPDENLTTPTAPSSAPRRPSSPEVPILRGWPSGRLPESL